MSLLHPALAGVSPCCSGLEGSLITCYSPVRRSTHIRRCFLARLACLIHAANVRSEPGSNPSLVVLAFAARECSSGIRIMVARSTCNLDPLLSEGSVETTCATGSRLRIRVQRTNPRLSGMSKICTHSSLSALRRADVREVWDRGRPWEALVRCRLECVSACQAGGTP